jgi:2-polyprenyl-3-methyl-5-hydroxy-6-metoxy-1,4-benzoquinol methylase
MMKRILKSAANRIKNLSRFWMFWKPDFIWLHKNRFLRMDANEPLYDKKRREFHLDRYKFAVDLLRDRQNNDLHILDAACGTGYGSDLFKTLNPGKIIGIDVSAETVDYANKKYGSDNCTFRAADITDLREFHDGMFDAVISFETIEHIEHPITFLENIKRLLNEKGTLIISTPNKWGPTKDHKFDYNYILLKEHLEKFFYIEDLYVQNSGSMDLWINRGQPRRLMKADDENREQAECFIAVCKKAVRDPDNRTGENNSS